MELIFSWLDLPSVTSSFFRTLALHKSLVANGIKGPASRSLIGTKIFLLRGAENPGNFKSIAIIIIGTYWKTLSAKLYTLRLIKSEGRNPGWSLSHEYLIIYCKPPVFEFKVPFHSFYLIDFGSRSVFFWISVPVPFIDPIIEVPSPNSLAPPRSLLPFPALKILIKSDERSWRF